MKRIGARMNSNSSSDDRMLLMLRLLELYHASDSRSADDHRMIDIFDRLFSGDSSDGHTFPG